MDVGFWTVGHEGILASLPWRKVEGGKERPLFLLPNTTISLKSIRSYSVDLKETIILQELN